MSDQSLENIENIGGVKPEGDTVKMDKAEIGSTGNGEVVDKKVTSEDKDPVKHDNAGGTRSSAVKNADGATSNKQSEKWNCVKPGSEDSSCCLERRCRCWENCYRAKTERGTTIAIIIAIVVVLLGTIGFCAYGPNFKSQESMNSSSSATTNTVVLGGYGDRGAYGYTYFQESNNGKR